MTSSLKGQLLIAAPTLVDPNFRRTVVLLLEHTEEGALGIVLNRPSETEARDAVPDLDTVLEEDEPIYLGGPVQPETVIALAEFGDADDAEEPVIGSVGSIEAGDDPSELGSRVLRARVFAGYAGWAEGQLEGEIDEEAWFTEPALPADVFTDEPRQLWASVLERMGSAYRLLARMPENPSWN